jgi:hypothetical protein
MIFNIANQPYVYEATPAAVRKLVLTEYCREIAEQNRGRATEQLVQLRLYSPARPYTEIERNRLRVYLESQIGRRYSVRGYVRDRSGDGIHCAEFVSTALVRTGRYQFPPSYSISPVSLVAQIKPTHAMSVELPTGEHRSRESWCHRSWAWWSGAFTWCGWACREFCTMWP